MDFLVSLVLHQTVAIPFLLCSAFSFERIKFQLQIFVFYRSIKSISAGLNIFRYSVWFTKNLI